MSWGGFRPAALSVILLVAVVTGGGALAYLSATGTGNQSRQALVDRAATIATSIDSEKVSELTGNPSDVNLPAYHELQTKLRLLKQSNTDARSIYLSGLKDDQVYFLVDSEVPGGTYYSSPGEVYPEATRLFKNVFAGTSPAAEGPLADSYGTWVSGLAPVVDLRTGRAVAVVGIDIDAHEYTAAVVRAAMPALLITLIVAAIICVYEWNRHRQRRILQLRSELMSVASHELRTPITGMRWAAESMLHLQTEGPAKAMAQAMYDSIVHLQAGAEDVLQLTRIQKNPKLQLAPTDLISLINEICTTQRILAGQKKVVITLEGSWPASLVVTCDPARMKQVFHNVVANAVKFAKPGTTVTLQYQRQAKRHVFTVTDQGIGIPKNEQSRIFEGFYRASNAKEGGESGTGLGLYLTKTILQQHHGTISFVSAENKGTTFTISLPGLKP